MTRVLLLVHAIVAIALLGAITHQCVASWFTAQERSDAGLVHRFRAVNAPVYATSVVVLYLLNFALGCVLYADYRIEVRPVLEAADQLLVLAAFESKEHLAVFGLGLLPAYWVLWNRSDGSRAPGVRKKVTALMAFFVWWSLIIGLVVNNIAGLTA